MAEDILKNLLPPPDEHTVQVTVEEFTQEWKQTPERIDYDKLNSDGRWLGTYAPAEVAQKVVEDVGLSGNLEQRMGYRMDALGELGWNARDLDVVATVVRAFRVRFDYSQADHMNDWMTKYTRRLVGVGAEQVGVASELVHYFGVAARNEYDLGGRVHSIPLTGAYDWFWEATKIGPASALSDVVREELNGFVHSSATQGKDRWRPWAVIGLLQEQRFLDAADASVMAAAIAGLQHSLLVFQEGSPREYVGFHDDAVQCVRGLPKKWHEDPVVGPMIANF